MQIKILGKTINISGNKDIRPLSIDYEGHKEAIMPGQIIEVDDPSKFIILYAGDNSEEYW